MTESADVKTTLDPACYWKLRTRLAQHELLLGKLREQEIASKAELDAAAVEAGLEPNKPYRLDDEGCVAVAVGP